MITKVETENKRRYLKLLQNISGDKVFIKEGKVWWKCLNCGYEYESEKAILQSQKHVTGDKLFKDKPAIRLVFYCYSFSSTSYLLNR